MEKTQGGKPSFLPLELKGLKKKKVKLPSRVQLCDSMEPIRLLHPRDFPGKSTGVGGHPLVQDLLHPGIEPGSLALQADALPAEPPWKTFPNPTLLLLPGYITLAIAATASQFSNPESHLRTANPQAPFLGSRLGTAVLGCLWHLQSWF